MVEVRSDPDPGSHSQAIQAGGATGAVGGQVEGEEVSELGLQPHQGAGKVDNTPLEVLLPGTAQGIGPGGRSQAGQQPVGGPEAFPNHGTGAVVAFLAGQAGAVLDLVAGDKESRTKSNKGDVKSFVERLGEDETALVLILDEITDVQNLGSILRSADQFGVSLVILPERRSAQINPTVIKVSSGAAHYVPVARVVNLNREIEYLKGAGFWVYGATLQGESLPAVTFPKRTVIVMGSEGKGISKMTEELCDHLVTIPTRGHIDSLNVSVATAIMLYEVRRQQP